MLIWGFLASVLIGGCAPYAQNDYSILYERLEVQNVDQKYVGFAETQNYKFNRTNFATNMTFVYNKDFGGDVSIEIQAFKMASNEYRYFPIRFSFNLCEAIKKNDFGLQNFYRCGNYTRCPMKKGTFVICKWSPDASRFPPYIPAGRYRIDLVFHYHKERIYTVEAYTSVKKIVELGFE